MNIYFWDSRVPFRHSKFLPHHNKNEIWGNLYKKLSKNIKNGFCVSVIGPRGSGKTQLGTCLIWYCAHKLKKSCFYTKLRDLHTNETPIYKTIDPDFLVIDNLEEFDKNWSPGVLNNLIDIRYEKQKSTILLSNDKLETFEAQMNESNIDRMREKGGIVELNLPSFRESK